MASSPMIRGGRPEEGAICLHEMIDELGDVLAPLDQRRHLERHHIQPVEQVLPEPARRHLAFEIAAGGGNDAYVHGHFRAAAYALELLLDKHAQQLALGIDGHIGDLVDIERAVMGFFERADLARRLAGFLDAEKLDLDPVRRHRGGIDRDEGPVDSLRSWHEDSAPRAPCPSLAGP